MSAPSAEPISDPSQLRILDFEIETIEGWSTYNLEDGNKIRARAVLLSVRGSSVNPKKGDVIAPETNVTVKVDSPPNRRGPKGSPATPEELNDPKGHGGVEAGITASSEPWNQYHLVGSNVRIRIKLVANHVWRIESRYDNLGDPVYVVTFSIIPSIEGNV